MTLGTQAEKVEFLRQELLLFGDTLFPTLQHFDELQRMTDDLHLGKYPEVETRVRLLGEHIHMEIAKCKVSA